VPFDDARFVVPPRDEKRHVNEHVLIQIADEHDNYHFWCFASETVARARMKKHHPGPNVSHQRQIHYNSIVSL